MDRKLLIVGGVAVLAAVLTTAFFYSLLSDRIEGADQGPVAPVVVASTDLARGTKLKPEHLTIDERPADALPEGSFPKTEDLVGKFIINSVSAGRPITARLLPGPGVNGLAAAIPSGMRAVTLHVEEYSGVNNIVQPGDRVDILAASDTRKSSRSRPKIETVLQNIEVLATDRERAEKDRRINPTVTVLIEDDSVEQLSLADEIYTIRFALRNPTDDNSELSETAPEPQAPGSNAPSQAAPSQPAAANPTASNKAGVASATR